MDDGNTSPLFRASKRQRVVRRKASASNDQESDLESGHQDSPATDLQNERIGDTDEPLGQSIPTAQSDLGRPRRSKKQGIAFINPSSRPRQSSNEKSIVLADARVPGLVQQSNERFVKPTGKAVVTDDKHMSAFIDSKLAELRYARGSTTDQQSVISGPVATSSPGSGFQVGSDNAPDSHLHQSTSNSSSQPTTVGTIDRATASTKSTYTRPPRRRPPPVRPEAAIARDSMIDQIMRESQVPHYDQSLSHPNPPLPNTTGDEDVDRDAAAAAAFKADFLAAALEKNYHRRAPANPTQGPKLGGSRSARERMKAMEEAQKGAGKTGKP